MLKSMDIYNKSSQEYFKCIQWKCSDLYKNYSKSHTDYQNVLQKAKENNILERMKGLISFFDSMNRTWFPEAVSISCDQSQCSDPEGKFIKDIEMMKTQLDFLNERWTDCSFKESLNQLKDNERKELEFIQTYFYPNFLRVYKNVLKTKETFKKQEGNVGDFNGRMTGLVRLKKKNRVALIENGSITNGIMKRVVISNDRKFPHGEKITNNHPKISTVMSCRVNCNIIKMWEWGNSMMENFLFRYRGIILKRLSSKRKKIENVNTQGGEGITILNCITEIPYEYSMWCSKLRNVEDKEKCKVKSNINIRKTLKSWVEYTFMKDGVDVDNMFSSWENELSKVEESMSNISLIQPKPKVKKSEEQQQPEQQQPTEQQTEQQ